MTLIEAIKDNNEKEFFEVLKLKTDPSGKRFIDEVDAEQGGNVLYWAATCGHIHFIEPLIKAGADVNKADNYGWTPVYAAAYYGRAEIILALKAGGADANTPNDSGTTPVCAAACTGGAAVITALKTAGANVNTPEINGLTPLYIAVQMGDVKVIIALLEAGANVHIKTPSGTALELARQSTELRDKGIVKLLETHQTALGLKEAEALGQLKEGYSAPEYTTITGIFGRPLTLAGQYINLQILCTDLKTKKPEEDKESKESAEAKPTEKYKDARMASVEDLFGDKRVIKAENLFKPIRELFNNQVQAKDTHEAPRLLLVQGRAGIGKTTFVRYAAHEWSKGRLYTNYTWVFTLTLRKLRLLPNTPELSLPEWIRLSQFNDWEQKEFDELWKQSIETAIHQNQVLLILDGYDETPEHHPCQSMLKNLLTGSGKYAKLSLLMTTRPCSAGEITEKRRNLEIIGFTDENINEYIQSYFESCEQTLVNTLTETLRKQPVIWANAHIPLNLNLLCGIMEEAIQKMQVEGLTQGLAGLSSMTRLYQVMEKKLYERSYTREEAALPNAVRQAIRANTDFTRHYQKERFFLATLAFQSFEAERIIIPLQVIGAALQAYIDKEMPQSQQQKEAIGDAFFKKVCDLGLIKPVLESSSLPKKKQDYEFLHLTFQEYYTAIYLAAGFSSQEPTTQTSVGKIISKEKYNPRWQIVWWFTAGLLRENTPVYKSYLQQLQDPSSAQKDIFEHYPLGLLTRCIDEGLEPNNQKAIEPIVKQLQSSFLKLYQTAKRITSHDRDGLSKLSLINAPFFSACRISPNLCMSEKQDLYALIPEPNQPKDKRFLSAWIGAIRVITPKTLNLLLGLLADKERTVRSYAAEVLGKLGEASATPKILEALLGLLAHEGNDVRCSAADALGNLGAAAATPKMLDALVALLTHKEVLVCISAAGLVGKLGEASATPKILEALLGLLTDKNFYVRIYAALALGKLGAAAATPKVLDTLLGLLTHKEVLVRSSAAGLVGKLGEAFATPKVLDALLGLLADEDTHVHSCAAEALGNLGEASATPKILEALLGLLTDEDVYVRRSVVETLGYLDEASATPKILEALLGLLADEDDYVRRSIAEALGNLGEASATPKTLDALLGLLADEDRGVRRSAAEALGKLGKASATPKILEALLGLLVDKDSEVRRSAAEALGKLGKASATPKILEALLGLLADRDPYVRISAARALGNLGETSATPKIMDALLRLLADKDSNVRGSAARALGNLGEAFATQKILDVLLGLLANEDSAVRGSAAVALDKLSNAAVPALFLDWLLGISSALNNDKTLRIFEMRIDSIFTLIPSFLAGNANHPNLFAFVSYTLAAAYLNSHISCQIDFDETGAPAGYYMRGFAGKSSYCILITEEQAKILPRLSSLVIEQLSKTGSLDIAELRRHLQDQQAPAQNLSLSTQGNTTRKEDGITTPLPRNLEEQKGSMLTQYQGFKPAAAKRNQEDSSTKRTCRIS